jgi:hypothetical protein
MYLAAPVRSRELTHIRMIKLATKYRRWHPVKVQQEVNGFSALRTAAPAASQALEAAPDHLRENTCTCMHTGLAWISNYRRLNTGDGTQPPASRSLVIAHGLPMGLRLPT